MKFTEGCKSVHIKNTDTELENVDEYAYLGIKFHKSGYFTNAVSDRVSKASRALYVLKQAISRPRLLLAMFMLGLN